MFVSLETSSVTLDIGRIFKHVLAQNRGNMTLCHVGGFFFHVCKFRNLFSYIGYLIGIIFKHVFVAADVITDH